MTWDHLHDEDVLFEFHGDAADELKPGHFYRGTVDGFADFGVFITIGDSVTGLLHRSNVDGRLENLDWEPDDDVIVQVEGVRENGNVDLAWSIRQSDEEFRGIGIHDPDSNDQPDERPAEPEPSAEPSPSSNEPEDAEDAEAVTASSAEAAVVAEPAPRPVDIEEVDASLDDPVRLEGRIEAVRQTSGPTIFRLEDTTGQIECAAFEAAGVRAYPDVEVGDVVAIEGRPEDHRGAVQVETETMESLPEGDRERIETSLEEAEREQARPEDTNLVVSTTQFEDAHAEIVEIATELRRAVFGRRGVVIRHPATVDGVVGAAAIERAVRRLASRTFADGEATGWFVERRPMEDPTYELGDAMYDITDGEDRHDVIAVVGAGGTEQDAAALDFLDVYETDAIVVDRSALDLGDGDSLITPLATNVAGMIDAAGRGELGHLPAIAAGYAIPESFRRLAEEHGYTDETIRERHEALSLISYYQRYDDKRELIADLLFDGEDAGELAAHVSEQFRQRLGTAVETAEENATRETRDERVILSLDAASLTHRYSFPPRNVLAEALRRETDVDAVVVLDEDAAFLSSGDAIDLEAIAATVDEHTDQAAVAAGRDRITFLAGRREAVHDALVDALAS